MARGSRSTGLGLAPTHSHRPPLLPGPHSTNKGRGGPQLGAWSIEPVGAGVRYARPGSSRPCRAANHYAHVPALIVGRSVLLVRYNALISSLVDSRYAPWRLQRAQGLLCSPR